MTQPFFKTYLLSVSAGLAVALGALAMSPAAFALESLYSVPLNKNELVRLPAPASAVIVGDPTVADVSIHSSDTILVIGRSFGETNLIILDEAGRTMMDADIQVVDSRSKGRVRVYKIGEGRETYNCTPDCLPAPALGDGAGFLSAFTSTAGAISNPIASAGRSASPTPALSGGMTTGPEIQAPR